VDIDNIDGRQDLDPTGCANLLLAILARAELDAAGNVVGEPGADLPDLQLDAQAWLTWLWCGHAHRPGRLAGDVAGRPGHLVAELPTRWAVSA
jgi:hypothetical protein